MGKHEKSVPTLTASSLDTSLLVLLQQPLRDWDATCDFGPLIQQAIAQTWKHQSTAKQAMQQLGFVQTQLPKMSWS